MTTGIQQNHRPGLPEPHEYAAHLERVLRPKKPTLRDRIKAALAKVIKPKSP